MQLFNSPQTFFFFAYFQQKETLLTSGEHQRGLVMEKWLVIYRDSACAFNTAQFQGLNLLLFCKGISVLVDFLFMFRLVATNADNFAVQRTEHS